MTLKTFFYVMAMIFIVFVLEHLPVPEIISWFRPAWVTLIVTVFVLRFPQIFGLWLAIPLGLMLDVEKGSLLGLNVVLLVLHIAFLQFLYKRIYLFNILQQCAVIFLLCLGQQAVHFWAVSSIDDDAYPVTLLLPALSTAFMWPWMYVIFYKTLERVQRT